MQLEYIPSNYSDDLVHTYVNYKISKQNKYFKTFFKDLIRLKLYIGILIKDYGLHQAVQ